MGFVRSVKRYKWEVRKRRKTGDPGFEPELTDSESVVLPLHQSPRLGPLPGGGSDCMSAGPVINLKEREQGLGCDLAGSWWIRARSGLRTLKEIRWSFCTRCIPSGCVTRRLQTQVCALLAPCQTGARAPRLTPLFPSGSLARITPNGQPSGAPVQRSRALRRRQCHYRHYRRWIPASASPAWHC